MDTDQRLAAYLSGDLDADERKALEAQLAGDAALRERLEAIRAADAMLADLPEVEPPEGFSDRLRDRLAPEMDTVLGDELAARRARRRTPSWVPAAAAAALVLVVGGIALSGGLSGGMGGGDDAGMTQEAAPDAQDDEAAAYGLFGETDSDEAGPGPRVVAAGRSITAADLEELAADPSITQGVAPDALAEDPDAFALGWAAALTSDPGQLDAVAEAQDGDTATASREETATSAQLTVDGAVTPEDLDDIGRCLSQLFQDAADPVVPLYAELAVDDDGTAVIVYAALSPDADGEYRRVEVWMIERSTCTLRLFHQTDQTG